MHILSYNSEKVLPDLFASLDAQTRQADALRVVDNGSTDGSVKYLQEKRSHALVARNVRNLGFTGGHNQLISFTLKKWEGQDLHEKAILIMNADMILAPDALQKLEEAFTAHPETTTFQPKILRLFTGGVGEDQVEAPVKSDVLDTTGLRLTRSWRMVDRGAGEVDRGQYDGKADILGASGAAVLFRASAFADLLKDGEVFDPDFFLYREDCDLALRLRRAGYTAMFVPLARIWHYRGMYGANARTLLEKFRDRRGRRPQLMALSSRNQLLLLVKNLTCGEWLRALPWILLDEGGRTLYSLIFEGETRKLLLFSPPYFFRAFKKRKILFSRATVPSEVMRSYVRP